MSEAADTPTNIDNQGSSPLLGQPDDILRHPGMTTAEKREVLARWASDAHAVENAPALRQLDDGSVVSVDEILNALRALDGEEAIVLLGAAGSKIYGRKRGTHLSRPRMAFRPSNDDDDPPPRPALAAYPVRFEVVDAVAA